MAEKRDKPEDIVLKLRQVEVLQGRSARWCCGVVADRYGQSTEV